MRAARRHTASIETEEEQVTEPSRHAFVVAGAAAGAATALGVNRVNAADAERPTLPIPAELRADADGEIAITARAGFANFLPGMATPTYGYNGAFLGPALRSAADHENVS